MINDIINNSLYGEIILLFLMVAYLFMRYAQRMQQKREGWNNFEFWCYYQLVDLFKFYGYPYPEIRAKEELQNIQLRINEECNKTETITT